MSTVSVMLLCYSTNDITKNQTMMSSDNDQASDKQFNLRLSPSLFDQLTERAEELRVSKNRLVVDALKSFLLGDEDVQSFYELKISAREGVRVSGSAYGSSDDSDRLTKVEKQLKAVVEALNTLIPVSEQLGPEQKLDETEVVEPVVISHVVEAEHLFQKWTGLNPNKQNLSVIAIKYGVPYNPGYEAGDEELVKMVQALSEAANGQPIPL